MRNKTSQIFIGLSFILLGVAFIGDVLNFWDFNLFFDGWWTLFIIIPCIGSMINNGINAGNVIGVGIGVVLFLSAQSYLSFTDSVRIILPAVLVIIGLTIIFKGTFRNQYSPKISCDGKVPDFSVIFSSSKPYFNNEKFIGAHASAIFGGVELNLRNAIIDSDCQINCDAIFGGIDILPPPNVRVKLSSTPIFGGASNKFYTMAPDTAPTLYINATCIFGGVEIK